MQESGQFNCDRHGVSATGRIRAVLAAAVLTALLAALVVRVAHIQFADPDRYTRLAAVHPRIEKQPRQRGDIYDRDGRLLATSVPHWSIFADPTEIPYPSETTRILSRVLDTDYDRTYARLLQTDRRFVWIKRQVSESRAQWVRALELKGVHMRKEYRRFHPYGSLCAHVVGFTDIDGRGLEGAEERFDDLLNGLNPGSGAGENHRGNGYDIHLTIDAYIQTLVHKALMRQIERHEPEAAWALVLDAGSGEILSMVSWPGYDPGAPAASPSAHRRNRIVTDAYEYGSVLKPIVAAIALEEGIIEPQTEFNCHRGAWRFGRRTIRDVSEHGVLSVNDIVARSSNIGMAQIGLQLGTESFWRGLRNFGFGEPGGAGLPGENIGIMRPASRWNDHSLISIAFGQELSVNALALARAFTALANDGTLIQPTLVHRITDPLSGDPIYEYRGPDTTRRAVSEATARQVREMLSRAVEEGTGQRAAVREYRVGGKTGTGTLMCEEGGGYSRDRYISTFVGLAPIDEPKVVVLVSLKVPTKGGYYGGAVAGPAFSEIILGTLGYLNVTPDQPVEFLAWADIDADHYEHNR